MQDLFTESDLERPPGIGTLALAAGIVRASAHDVARIAFSEVAWRAALLVSKSCLRASVRGADIYPQGVFPFEGRTTFPIDVPVPHLKPVPKEQIAERLHFQAVAGSAASGVTELSDPFGVVKNCHLLPPPRSPMHFVIVSSSLRSKRGST